MVYIDQKKTIFLNPSSKKKLFTGNVEGDICLEANTYDIDIELISDVLPSSTYTIQVSVEPIDKSKRVFNAGVRRKEQLELKKIIPPEIEIRKISLEAVLTIQFSDDLYPIDDFEKLKAFKEINLEGDKRPAIEIDVEPVEDQPKEDVAFTWKVLSFSEKFLIIQLDFENLQVISQAERNMLTFKVWEPNLFRR